MVLGKWRVDVVVCLVVVVILRGSVRLRVIDGGCECDVRQIDWMVMVWEILSGDS
jgi:hypothetical protein